jgi:hypothetical protein
MVIRQLAVSDQMNLPEFNDIFCAILGCGGNLGYIFRVHTQEFSSFRRKTRSKAACLPNSCRTLIRSMSQIVAVLSLPG